MSNKVNTVAAERIGLMTKLRALMQLLKFRLSFLVAFSAGMAYLMGVGNANYHTFTMFLLGGFMVTGAANTINQIIEVDYDRMMKRTMNRPLPTGKLNAVEAGMYAVLLAAGGTFLHFYYINPLTGMLSFLSMLLYAFVYTPMKRVGPIAVFVGAIPGALPPMIGWVGATGTVSIEAWILFGIQFMWQFPHFWAVAWVADEDYKKAGYNLLPSKGGKDLNTAFNIMIYTLFLIPISLLPLFIGLTGVTSAIIVTLAGIAFLAQTFYLMKTCDRKDALRMMFASFFYLPIVQIAFVVDKV